MWTWAHICSCPIVKYTENESLLASPVSNINMFDKKTHIMRIFNFDDRDYEFYSKMQFCEDPDHCNTFLSTPIVNYTDNMSLVVSSVIKLKMLDKGVDIMGLLKL